MTTSTQADLLTLLESGNLLLLPTPAAARQLRSAYDAHQRARNIPAWLPANALAWPQFTSGLFAGLILNGTETRLLLNPAQEQALWREVLTDSTATPATLASADSLAQLASSAFHLAAAYDALPRLRASATTPDTRTFAAWADAFLHLCSTRGLLSSAQLDHALAVQLGHSALPSTLHLIGFHTLTPSQQAMLAAITDSGTTVTHHQLAAAAPIPPQSLIAADPREELRLAAAHLKRLFQTNPQARATLLLPTLSDDRDELESVLRSTLAPGLNHIAADLSSAPWQFSTGTPLATHTLIAHALQLLQLATGPVPLPTITTLLLSPYLANHSLDTAARLDAHIRRNFTALRPELDLSRLLSQTGRFATRNTALADTLPTWPGDLLTHLQRSAPELSQPRTYADWMELLRALLSVAGWPGPRTLTASELATTQAWDGALDLVSTLDFAGRRVPFSTAFDALSSQLQTTLSTPLNTHAPIQIMAIAESAGTVLDTAILLRATDANWPPPQRPHPLIPWQLQAALHMPGTDPALDTAHARTFTQQLVARTASLLITSAAEDADGKLRPSPLITEFNPAPAHPAIGQPATGSPAPPLVHLETVPDNNPDSDPLPPPPTTEVHGGSGILKAQAACGFQAFATYRLRSTEPDTAALGLDAGDSGDLLHRTLQAFWKTVPSRDDLKALATDARTYLLDACIAQALAEKRLHPSGPWETAYLDLQKQRLRGLLLAWLQLEEQRGPFTVLATEDQQRITVGPLILDVRTDRIDSVEDSNGPGVLFVDYKTGLTANPNQWLGERPDDPQLPLYALLPEPAELKGLAFARIRTGPTNQDMRWHGYHTEEGILPRTSPTDLADLIDQWHATLTRLAEDFYTGQTSIDPKNYPTTCQFCKQRLLCRFDPATQSLEADDA